MLPVVLSATFMSGFDVNVVNVAVPALQHDLHAGQAAIELVVAGYAFTYASGLVTGGRLGDLYGYRKLFMLGMALFTVASLLCGLAQSPGQLVAARLVQGLTASAMVPQVLALITATFPASERPRALSWLGVVIGLGGIAGQVIGGLLLNADLFGLGWRVIFFVNVPVGALVLGFAARLVPATRSDRRPRLDPIGVIGISGSLALALVPLALGREQGWPLWTWISLAASVPVMAAALLWERRLTARGGQPLLDLSLFRARSFSAGLTINVAFMAYFISFILVLSLLLQSGTGLSPLQAGLAYLPLALLTMATSIFGRPFVVKYGVTILAAGTAAIGLGILAIAIELQTLGADFTVLWTVAPFSVMGLGGGVVLPSMIGVVLTGVRPDQAGAASGVITTSQQFAGAAGVAALGAVFFSVLGSHPTRAGYAHAAAVAVWIDLALIVVMLLLTALLPHPRPAAAAPAAPAATGQTTR